MKAFTRLTQGKELDVIEERNILSMLTNLNPQQLHDFIFNTPNATVLQL